MTTPKNKRLLILGAGLAALLLGAPRDTAAQTFSGPPPDPTGRLTARALDAAKLQAAVGDLAANAAQADVSRVLEVVLPELLRASAQDAALVASTLRDLAKQPQAAAAFAQSYRELPSEAFQERLFTMGMVGELRRAEALPFLREVISAPLPAQDPEAAERLSERELEEMIQAKAVQGLAYLASKEADAVVRDAMLEHESTHVRVTAIDAYMFNHQDSPEVAKELYELLPEELHPYVERPRFHAGMDPKAFAERVDAWQAKWGSSELPE